MPVQQGIGGWGVPNLNILTTVVLFPTSLALKRQTVKTTSSRVGDEGYVFPQSFEGLGPLPRSESGTVCPRELAFQPSALSLKSLGALVGCSVQISQERQGKDNRVGGTLASLGF